MNNKLKEGFISDYIFQTGKFTPKQQISKNEILEKARKLQGLESFTKNRLPNDAYNLWKNMINNGFKIGKPANINEPQKVTYNRFLSKKNDEYKKLCKEFKNLYGHDYYDINIPASIDANEIVWNNSQPLP